MTNDRDIPGMGDYSPPDEPDEAKAGEAALMAVAALVTLECIRSLYENAMEEHQAFFNSIGEDHVDHALGDYMGPWYETYIKARDAFDEGKRLTEQTLAAYQASLETLD